MLEWTLHAAPRLTPSSRNFVHPPLLMVVGGVNGVNAMNSIIYLVGLVVIVLAVLSLIGLR